MDKAELLTLGIFLVGQLTAAIWWASKINTTLCIMTATLTSMNDRLTRHEASFFSKEEAAKDFAHRDIRIDAIGNKLDKIQDHIQSCPVK